MTDKMKKILRNTGWQVVAAALVLGMTACSSENDLSQEPTQQPTQTAKTIHVTVGAGIDSNTTRSAVVTEDGKRKLTFTAGDKLYIYMVTQAKVATSRRKRPRQRPVAGPAARFLPVTSTLTERPQQEQRPPHSAAT